MTSPGRRFVDAIVARDREGLRAAVTDDVDFKALTPGRFWEAGDPAGVEGIVLGSWFEDQDRITDVLDVSEDDVADTRRLGYRFAITNGNGPQLVEQQAYYRADGDRVSYVRIVCSGFRPT